MIKSILLAVDGSAYTEPVLMQGISLARYFKAHLKVLTVIDVRIFEWAVAIGVEGFAPVIPSSAYLDESQKLLEQKAEEVLKRTREILQDKDISFSLEKESGNPIDTICEKARLVDLVIMGARGEFAKWSDKMLGATLESLSRICIKSLLITQRAYREIKKILIAYDGSNNASRALTFGAHFAETMKIPLVVLTVSAEEKEGDRILEEAREYLQPYRLSELSFHNVTGEAAAQIVKAAEKENADLIVMGSYGHSRIREAILGSNTVQVMRNADVPVLLAR
ncbi:MAG: universal stress protein [Calditrichia bacterium]